MAQADLFLMFLKPLNQMGVRYMVTGAAAAVTYGMPRMTNDIDVVIMLKKTMAGEFKRFFPQESFYCPVDEVIEIELNRSQRGHFNIIHMESGFKADFYPSGKDELNAWGLGHAREIVLQDEKILLAPPEYVILRKMEYFREGGSGKHIQDIKAMLDALAGDLDIEFILRKAVATGLGDTWERIVKET